MMLPPFPELDLPTTLRALEGDAAALSRLYVCHRAQVLRVAQRTIERISPHEEAAELAQEVWFRLLDHGCRRLRSFDPARGPFARFLQMVAWQQALTIVLGWVRRQQREPLGPWQEQPLEPSCPPEADGLDHRQILCSIIRDVSPRLGALDRTVLEEVYVKQTLLRELAPRLGCSKVALRGRSRRLRAWLCDAARRLDAECDVQ
jgi:RNA polymerase sigma factor (sigma-70 family)